METLVTVHSWVRWLVLASLVTGAVVGTVRYRRRQDWDPTVFQVGVMTADVQVSIGAVIWVVDDAFSETFFFKILHPAFMLTALAIAHVGVALAKHRADVKSNLLAGSAFVVSLILIIAAIPWNRL